MSPRPSWLAELVPARGPARRLAGLTVVQAVGASLFLTSAAIFLTRTIGLSATQVGTGLSVAGLCGFLATVPVGRLADRIGARTVLAAVFAVLSLLFVSYSLVGDFPSFVVVASLIAIGESALTPLKAALLYATVPPDQAVRARAQMRSAYNLGLTLGAALASVALTVGTRTAFAVVVCSTATALAVCAVLTARIRSGAARTGTARQRPGRTALRDARFLALTLLNGLLEVNHVILTVGIPLWLVTHTGAPRGVAAVAMMVNTVMVVALQVRLSRGAHGIPRSARLLRRSGVLLAVACLPLAASQHQGPGVATALLLAATVVLTVAELLQNGGAWTLSFELAAPQRQGEYQAVFGLGRGVQQFFGPAVVTWLAIALGAAGWLVIGAFLLVAGALVVPVVRGASQARVAVPAKVAVPR
ncbi:MAG: hypothetical protein V7603_4649 [Micromonosporaceae bacterium]